MTTRRSLESRELAAQAVALRREKFSYAQIAQKLGKSKTFVAKILKKYDKTGSLDRIQGSGRPSLLTDEDRSFIISRINENPKISAPKLAALVAERTGNAPSSQTIRNALHELNFRSFEARRIPLLTKKNMQERLKMAKAWILKLLSFWDHVIFSDETKINMVSSDGRTPVWRRPGEVLNANTCVFTVKHGGGSIMAWGCMSSKGVGRLALIEGKMNAVHYTRILVENLEASCQMMGFSEGFIYQQDNDPKHTAALTRKFFAENGIELLKWPSQSPDLNPIEHLWAYVKQELRNKRFRNKAELWEKVQEIWYGISPELCKKLVHFMPRRMEAVIRSQGGATKY
jgi:transposase